MSVLAPRSACIPIFQNGPQRYGGEMEAAVPQRRYTLNEDFYTVLSDVGAIRNQAYEWKDVIMLFLRYLAKRKPSLFDPLNKSRVLCETDPLGAVFGVSFFTKEQTRLLVRQHITLVDEDLLLASLPPLPAAPGSCPPPETEPAKRGPSDDPGGEVDVKRSRAETEGAAGPSAPPPPEAAQPTGTGSLEPPGADTDDEVPASPAVEEPPSPRVDTDDQRQTYAREMEPIEPTDVSDADGSSGESDVESPLSLTTMAVWVDDVGMLADLETSESDSEHRDTWLCPAPDCQHANSARKSRCDRCWKLRPSWVVGPRRKKRRQRDQERESALLSRSAASEGSVCSQDSGRGSQESSSGEQSCVICCERPRNAAIIHGRTGCQVSCYRCARRLWKMKQLCPACRRTIEKIVYMRFG